ncbi:hypothetical protein EDD22DRAFT_966385 [Suillus occidentalis]|nr:hypothetical protein EDD22DRAFT_966385 [Suillus occidentalis]
MSTVADNAVVADDPIANGHQVHDSANSFEIPSKLATDGEVVEAVSNGVQESALGAEDVSGVGDKIDDTLVTASSNNTLASETSVEVLNVSKLVNDMEPEAPTLHTSDSDKENTTLIHDSEPLANGHHKSLFVEESEQLTTLTIVPCDEPASLAELVQEDAIECSGPVTSEIPKDELPITDSIDTEIPCLDVATIVVEASKASLDDREPPIAASTGPDMSLSDLVTTSINGVGSTTDAESSHRQDETPISHPSTEMSSAADMLEEVVVPPAVEVEEISLMAPNPEPVVVEDACDPIEAEASPMEVAASCAGDEPVVTETVVSASVDPVPETAPAGENILDEQESVVVEAESSPIITQSSTAELGSTPTTLEATPIKSTLREVVVEESPVCEPDAEPAVTLEPTPEDAEGEPVEDTTATVEPVTEVGESDPTEEIVPVSEAVATVAAAEVSGAEAEESVTEVDAPIAAEKEANEEPQGAIDAEEEPAIPTAPEILEVSVSEFVSALAKAATRLDIPSTEPEDAVIALTPAPEIPVVAAEAELVNALDSVTADSEPVTAPDPEPVAATAETDSVAAAGHEPTAFEPRAPAAVDAELTEPAVESLVTETVQIDIEPPSSNASLAEDSEVDFTDDDEPQTPLAEETLVLKGFVLDATDMESEVQVEESSVEETVEVIPIDVVTPTGGPASVEEVVAEGVAAVEEVVTVEEFLVEESAAVEETVPIEDPTAVEETKHAEEVVPVDVATGEPAPIEEVLSVEAVEIEGYAPVEEVTLVEDITPIESAAPIKLPPPAEEAVVDEAEPAVEELAAPVNDGPILEAAMPSVDAADVEAPLPTVSVSSPNEPAASNEEPLVAPEEASGETTAPAIEVISLAGNVSKVEDISALPLEVPVGEDAPAIEERSVLAEVDVSESGTVTVAEHVAAVQDTLVREDHQSVAIEETPADAEEPVSVDDRISPTMDETPLFAEVPSDTDEPALEATSAKGKPHMPEEESVEDVILMVEESLEPSDVEAPEPVAHEESMAPMGDHEPVAIEDTSVQLVTIDETPATEEASVSIDNQIPPAINEMPVIAEVPSAADQPALDVSPTTEEPSALEEELATASIVETPPTAGDVATAPKEIPWKAEETIPVFEVTPTPADPMLADASSLEGTAIVADESTVESDASVTELPVAVQEPAPAVNEASVVEVVVEEVQTALERTEAILFTSDDTKGEFEDSQHAEVPVSLPEQPFVEESLPTAPIVEEFVPTPVEEPEISALHVVASQVPVNGEHTGVNKDSEPPIVHIEISGEIEETEAVEQPETIASEEVTEQQEIAASPALSIASDIERPKSPWTPSYSVITQGSGIPDEEHISAYEGDDDDAAPAQSHTPEIIIYEVAAIVPEIVADVEVFGQSQVEVLQLAEEQVTLGEAEEPRPISPWTPSYSVTVQGNVVQTNEGLDDLEQLPPSAAQSVTADQFEEQTVSYTEALSEVTSSTTVVADQHFMPSATLDESDVPDSAVKADAQDIASEQSVTAQAEPSVPTPPEPAPVEEMPEEEIEQGSFIVDDESTHLSATDPDGERSSSPWTLSYSVTGLKLASALEDQAVAKDGESIEHGSFIIETQAPVDVEDAPGVKSDSELLTPVDDPVGERPKSPWTPSYSVTMQGPNEAVEEVQELEHLPGPPSSIPAFVADEEPIPPVLITETRASVDEPVTAEALSRSKGDVTVSELFETCNDVEASEVLIALETPQTFPVLEEPQKIANKKPSLSAVDELNATEVTETSTLRIDIPTNNGANRNRLESTTSSRFFPGGWFSSSPKVPEEGRTSLDVAAGEFVHPVHKSSVENTPTTAPTTALPSAVEEDKEKKSRWCTIM